MAVTALPDLNALAADALRALILAQHEQLLSTEEQLQSREREIEHLKLLLVKQYVSVHDIPPFKLSPVNEDFSVATSHTGNVFFRSGATPLSLQTRVSAASDVSLTNSWPRRIKPESDADGFIVALEVRDSGQMTSSETCDGSVRASHPHFRRSFPAALQASL
jgi:hypothetical protein